jgi:excisionase family DNA binding protein
MKSSESALLTVRDVARRLGIGVRTVWKWTATGQLPPPVRLSGSRFTRWRAADLEQYIAELPLRR